MIKNLISDGKNLGINISYKEQDKPRGLPDAFILGEKFIGKECCNDFRRQFFLRSRFI